MNTFNFFVKPFDKWQTLLDRGQIFMRHDCVRIEFSPTAKAARLRGGRQLILLLAVGLILVTSPLKVWSAMSSGFTTEHVSTDPVFSDGTYGWSFWTSANGPDIRITQLGIYDDDGNGLTAAHTLGLWAFSNSSLVASASIAAGESSPIVGGFRYVAITPVVVRAGEGFSVGAYYGLSDPDGAVKPDSGSVASVLNLGGFGGSVAVLGRGLSLPSQPLCRFEGEPCYRFYPVNFQFEIIPEPSTACLFALGLGGMLWVGRRTSRRRSDEPVGTAPMKLEKCDGGTPRPETGRRR